MLPRKKNGKQVTACKCGYTSSQKSESIKESVESSTPNVGVVEQKDDPLPVIEEECPKCENRKAYYWTMQTRAADEGETKFLKCVACKHVWRDYG